MSVKLTREGVVGSEGGEPAPHEPKEWGAWAKERIEDAARWLREREAKRMERGLLSAERVRENYRIARRGALARQFLESEFWRDHVAPELCSSALKPWRKGEGKDLEAVAVEHLFESGRSTRDAEIVEKLKLWVRDGELAKKALDENRKRQEAAQEARRV